MLKLGNKSSGTFFVLFPHFQCLVLKKDTKLYYHIQHVVLQGPCTEEQMSLAQSMKSKVLGLVVQSIVSLTSSLTR